MEYKGNIWSALITLILGIVLVFLHKLTIDVLVVILGFALIAAGAIDIVATINGTKVVMVNGEQVKKKRYAFLSILTSAAAIILGLWWVIDPQTNTAIIITLFGLIAIVMSLYHLFSMKITFKDVTFPVALYVVPILVLLCGIVMVVMPRTFESFVVIFVGILLIVSGLSMICQAIVLHSFNKKVAKGATSQQRKIEDVNATEVH